MTDYYIPKTESKNPVMKEIDRSTEIGIDSWGTTTNPFEHQTQALKARIFHGANRIEFEFFGAGKGRKEAATPESFGKRERMDMRELAEINEVETTTHATVGITGLSGLDMQSGSFDDRHRKEAIDEIKRAIHFAAEATTGGAVVFHTGEAPRYMYGKDYMKDEKGNPMFMAFPEEEKRRKIFLVDPISKRLVAQVSDIDRLAVPIYKRDENGRIQYLKDENGNYVIDPTLKDYDTIHEGKVPLYETDEEGNIKTEIIDFNTFRERRRKEYIDLKKKEPSEKELAKDFFYQQKFVDVMYSLYFGIGHEKQYKELLEQREKIIKTYNFYKQLKEKVPKDEWWRYEKEIQYDRQYNLLPPDTKDPIKILKEMLLENERNIAYIKELALHGRRTASEQLDVVKRSELAEDFAVEQSAKSMAELGIYAWQMTEKAKKEGQGENGMLKLKHPIYIAPENLFPEVYGSHPDELRRLVESGRKEMEKELKEKYKISEEKAKELAKEHIKATFDISHANIWRKYFVSKPGESLEERDKRFNEWLVKEAKKLIEDGIVGHIHVSDNFGFHDEHLTAGDGNVPLKEFIKAAKDAGLSEFIVESGSFNPMTSLPDTWMHFDSSVYNLHVPGFKIDPWTEPSIGQTPYGWNNFYRSYFGRTEGPRYLVGDTAPSEDYKGAPFYSGLSME